MGDADGDCGGGEAQAVVRHVMTSLQKVFMATPSVAHVVALVRAVMLTDGHIDVTEPLVLLIWLASDAHAGSMVEPMAA